MRFEFGLDMNRVGPRTFWTHPRIVRFLNSRVRKKVSAYPNYFRFIWWKIGLMVQWGSRLHP